MSDEFFYVDPTHTQLWGVEMDEDTYLTFQVLGKLDSVEDIYLGPIIAMSRPQTVWAFDNSPSYHYTPVIAVLHGSPQEVYVEGDCDSLHVRTFPLWSSPYAFRYRVVIL